VPNLAQLAGVAAASGDRAAMEAVSISRGSLAELEAENDRLRRVVLDLEAEEPAAPAEALPAGAAPRGHPPARDALGTLYVTITEDDRGQAFEVFMSLGKAGGALMADARRWAGSSAWRSGRGSP